MASGSALGMGSGSALTIGGGATVPVAPAEPSIPANTGPVLRNGSALSMPGPGQQSSSLGSPLVQGQLAAGPMAPPIPGPISSSRSVLVDLTALDAPPAPAAVAPLYATAALAARAAPPMAAAPLGRPAAVIYFGNASSKLSAHDRKVLRQLAQLQRRHGGQVLVVGHSSTDGDPALNLRLSERRAGAVAAALRGFGIPAAGIATDALGAEQPLYQETSATGEAGNRRVEIYLGS
ncbi:MAG: OmpA family protein [Dongiaceae bacterium]